jgi:hypothetical protein
MRAASALLEHAEHDGADKGEHDICGKDAQSACEGHGTIPWVTSLPDLFLLSDHGLPKKTAWLSMCGPRHREPGNLG